MNITKEQTGPQTATLKIEIVSEDYAANSQKVLKDYQKKASIPGFRPGHVPVGLIKKMYGKAVVADEVNKLLTETLSGYIRDENLNILGNPMPNKEKTQPVSFEDGESMEFYFDLGFAPEFDLKLDGSLEVDDYSIRVEEDMLNNYIEETRRRFGDYTHPDEATESDMLSGEAVELATDGQPLEGGISKNVLFTLEKMKDAKAKSALAVLKKGESIAFNPVEFLGSIDEAVQHLGLKAEEISAPGLQLRFTLQDISHLEPAGLNSEFYNKVYPGHNLETYEDFRAQVLKDASSGFVGETDKILFNTVSEKLVRETELPLPDEFLKRWLKENDEKSFTDEEIESQYPAFADSMRWQLIENKVIREHNIEVKDEDIRTYIRTVLLRQMDASPADPEIQKRYESVIDAFMQNKEQVQRINDQLYNARLLELFKQTLRINKKEVSYEEFVKLVSEKHQHDHTGHDHDHDHHHGHDHDHDHHHTH
jgi:trigger factor